MTLTQKMRGAILRMAYPVVARYYRSHPATNFPPLLFQFLGIIHESYRPDFYTVSRVVREMGGKGGLIAECGVYRGGTLLGMAHILKPLGDYQLIGFDSFEGFPAPQQEDALKDGTYHSRALQGVYSDTSREELCRKIGLLGHQGHITLVPGYFENTLSSWDDKIFSVVHLDVDLYGSYLTCLEFFYPRVRSGGYIIFDEYASAAHVYPGAQKAIDAFLLDKPERIQRFAEAQYPRYFIVKQ